jgi:hypothetical protein
MIRRENLAADSESFAAERRNVITAAEDALRPHVKDALYRAGLPQWFRPVVSEALDLFDTTARAEVDAWNPVLDDMHDAFAEEIGNALAQTKRTEGDAFNAQVEAITRWLAVAAHNAAMEAATTSDPDETVGLEWVTMGDSTVREAHREAHGQVVPTGQPFSVGDVEMLYPGQPVGDPSNWMNCRCVARPTSLDGEFKSPTTTFAGEAPGLKKDGNPPVCKYCEAPATQYVLHSEGMAFVPACDEHIQQAKDDAAATTPDGTPDPGNIDKVGKYALTADGSPDAGEQVGQEEYTSTVIVALPAADDPISAASSETSGAHATLLFLGDSSVLDEEALNAAVKQFVEEGQVGIITEQVNGRATLGADAADVVLFDAANLVFIRNGLLTNHQVITDAYEAVEQFPTWLPHVTLGYPETPATAEYTGQAITFDRLAVWHGESRTEYPLGGTMPEKPAKPEALTAAGDAPADEMDPAVVAEQDELMTAIEGLDEESYPEIPWHSVVTVEVSPSEDGRAFTKNGIDSRNLPLPLKAQFIDDDGHDGSVIVGRIDRLFRDGNLIKAEGVFDTTPQAYEALRMVATGMWRGVSVDVTAVEGAYAENEDGQQVAEYSKARIASTTLCAIPAFAEAYIALGTWADAEGEETAVRPAVTDPAEESVEGEFKNVPIKTKDGPGWVTEPKATKRITDYWVDGPGAIKIDWGVPGDFNRCRANLAKYVQNPEWLAGLCANLHYRALGIWPGRGAGAASELNAITAAGGEAKRAPLFNLVASASVAEATVSVDYFLNPMLEGPTPLTVTPDGRVFGHIATWDTCHIAFKDECVLPPRSATDYAYFLTGEVLTDAGPVPVGQITMNGPHADGMLSMSQTIAHYDNTTTPIADVTVYEDDFGIVCSGMLRPGITVDDVRVLRASAISGDWRGVVAGGQENLELVAALAVNVPGFPIPRTQFAVDGGRTLSLVAAGAVPNDGDTEAAERFARAEAFKIKARQLRAADFKARANEVIGE